jgi:arylsulfatase A-like enzyme
MTRIPVALGIAATLVIGVPVAFAEQPSGSSKPNIVLIVADDLGYGDLGSYGAPDTKTPNLDRLAREGVRLTDYYANAPVCTPTRAALISGRYQQRVMLERPLQNNPSTPATGLDIGLPVTGRSLPQLLKNAGYATALVGKWHLGFKPQFHPNAHGFTYFWGYLAGAIDWYAHVRGDGEADLWENDKPVTFDGYFDHELTKRAVSFIRDHAREPFFIEVAMGAPHWPFQSPHHPSVAVRKNNSMFQQAADPNPPTRSDYVEIVEDADVGIGRILEAIEQQGLAPNTLVIFISDNGGEWLSRNAPFFHRKDTLWEGGVRVPAILRWPGVLPSGRTSSQVAITMDLTATILHAAGADTRDARLEGIDLVPLLRGTSPSLERTLFWRVSMATRQQRSVRSGDWKLLVDGTIQMLFDVRRDPGERNDLAARHPEIVRKLQAQIEAWEKDVDGEAASNKSVQP